jgi:hypothetical protein
MRGAAVSPLGRVVMMSFDTLRGASRMKITAAVAVVAVAAVGTAAAGGGSVAANGGAPSEGRHGWPTAPAHVRDAKTVKAIEKAAADRQALVLHARSLREADVDADGDGQFGPGDYFVFEEALRRPQSSRRVGTTSARCMLNTRTFMCDGTMSIDGVGKISIQGSLFSPRDVTLPVTGGSGKFRHVSGQFRVFEQPQGRSLYVFDLRTR